MQATWKEVDRELRRLAQVRAQHDYEQGRWLLAARRTAVHTHFGFASLGAYVERVFGYDGRTTNERLRVAQALESLPAISDALEKGTLPFSAVRELTRVAVPETQTAWLQAASGKTVREIEDAVAGLRPGESPTDTPDPAMKTQIVRLELRPEALALFREAVGRLRHDVDARLSDEDALLEMARRVLGGPKDEGRSPYQVVLTQCPSCTRAWQQGRGEPIEVDAEVAERARCDAQEVSVHLGDEPHVGTKRAAQRIPPATRRLVLRRDGGRCRVTGCRNSCWLEAHHITLRSEGGTHDPEQILTLCGAHHRFVHRGLLLIEGTASTGLSFRHADGTLYGDPTTPQRLEANADAFAALRSLGLREGDARRSLAAARAHVGANASLEDLVREAIRLSYAPARTYALTAPP